MLAVIQEHIDATPGICGGRPRIAGHRIRVMDIVVLHEKLGQSPDEIVSIYTTLTLADVYAALAYYFDHPQEIQNDLAEDRALAEDMALTNRGPLKQRLAQLRGQ